MNLERVIEVFDKKANGWMKISFDYLVNGDIFRIFDSGNRYVDPDNGNNIFIAISDPYMDVFTHKWKIDTLF